MESKNVYAKFTDAQLSPPDKEQMREVHESFCEMTNVGLIVSRLYSRKVISEKTRQQLNRYLKDEGSFTAASKNHIIIWNWIYCGPNKFHW